MFDQVFRYQHYTQELRTGPLSAYLDEFAHTLFERGHSRRKVRNKFIAIGQLSRWMRRHRLSSQHLNDATLQKFIRAESRRIVSPLSEQGEIASLKLLTKILRNKGILPTKVLEMTGTDVVLNDFGNYLSADCGITPGAIYCYKRYVGFFLKFKFENHGMRWDDINAQDFYRFLLWISRRFAPGTTKLVISGLRSFFRFLKLRGLINFDLATAVPSVPCWRARNLPYYLNKREVEKLLSSIDQSSSLGKRDFAILLLLVRLGLRGCEVANLGLDDLDWTNGEIVINGKGVKKKRLPLPNEVGRALVAYLKVRPKNEKTRHFFLRSFPPYVEFTRGLVGIIVRKALDQANLTPFKSGSHLLRHTAATEMLRKGASLQEIGMVLGHQGIDSTAIYAKVDLASLDPIVRPWPTCGLSGGAQ